MPPPSPSGDKDTLSIPATLLYRLGLPIATAAISTISPSTALFVPVLAAPTAWLLHQRSRLPPADRPGQLETLLWTFLGTSTLGPALAITAQSALSYLVALFIFGPETKQYLTEFTRSAAEVHALPPEALAQRATLARSWPYIAYIFIFSFTTSGLPEEVLKYSILTLLKRLQKSNKPLAPNDYILYATTLGLSYAFFESLAFIYAAAETAPNTLLITALERILYGTAAHSLTAILTATYMAKRDLRGERLAWWRVLGPAVLYHGAGNAWIFGQGMLDGQVGFMHPETMGEFVRYAVGPAVLVVGLGVHVVRGLKEIGVKGLLS